MLDNLGHERVAVLDGGFRRLASGGPAAVDASVPRSAARASRSAIAGRGIDRPRRSCRAELGDVSLLDARAPERYRGETEPIDPVAGHIPTALNAPAGRHLGPDGRFLPPEPWPSGSGGSGAAAGTTSCVSCGSGVIGRPHALAMRVAGLPDPILYPGSFSDWSTAGYPVATGPEPGKLPAARAGSGPCPRRRGGSGPVRNDAAGESRNAPTRPSSSGSP